MATFQIRFVIIVLLISISLLWADQELENIYDNVVKKYAKIKTYEADFLQENSWKELNKTKKSNGKVYFDTNNFLLKYSDPEGQILLIEDVGITLYDSASGQAIISDRSNAELRPDKLIAEYWNNSIKEIKLNEGNFLILKFTTADGSQIHVGLEEFLVTDFRVVDKAGNSVIYVFKDAIINKKLSKKIFKIDLPEDANIIDQRSE
jgi:outer membrane lipoprotein-sorting protein